MHLYQSLLIHPHQYLVPDLPGIMAHDHLLLTIHITTPQGGGAQQSDSLTSASPGDSVTSALHSATNAPAPARYIASSAPALHSASPGPAPALHSASPAPAPSLHSASPAPAPCNVSSSFVPLSVSQRCLLHQ